MGASMCVPVCMFVFTRTVLLPSRACVVISLTSTDANCGHVGIRSPHGWVRSTSFIRGRCSREPLDAAQLLDDLLRDGEVCHVNELHVLGDLAEALLARDRPVDVRLRHAFVLRP